MIATMPQWAFVLAVHWPLAVLTVMLTAAAWQDLRTGKIANLVTYPGIILGLAGHTVAGGIGGGEYELGLSGAAAGLAVGLLPMVVIWLMGGIGGGDVKLMAAVGALVGWRLGLSVMFYSFLAGALLAVIIMLRRRIAMQTLGRLWRFVYLAFTPTKPADPATAGSPRVPFGLAVAMGTVAAVAEALLRGPSAINAIFGV